MGDERQIEAEFPAACLRGLRKKDHLTDGVVNTAAYIPDPRTAEGRADNGAEVSVNWEDDDTVLAFTLSKREATGFGVARLPRARIDDIASQPGSVGALWYERASLDDNTFHGNLLFLATLKGPRQKMIAAALALASEAIPRQA